MRLLVSVRSAAEVAAALAGGADIIDAKEPSRGGLGAVDPETLEAIAGRVPLSVPLSVALGDLTTREQVRREIGRLALRRPGGELFLKLGFAGVTGEAIVVALIGAAIQAAHAIAPAARIVAVAYGDGSRVAAPSPAALVRAATTAGAAGVLLDTSLKDGRDLLDWVTPAAVQGWVDGARDAGMLTAVAGSLGVERLPMLHLSPPDILGVRGAACDGGRLGNVSATRVRDLRSALDATAFQPPVLDEVPAKREATSPASRR